MPQPGLRTRCTAIIPSYHVEISSTGSVTDLSQSLSNSSMGTTQIWKKRDSNSIEVRRSLRLRSNLQWSALCGLHRAFQDSAARQVFCQHSKTTVCVLVLYSSWAVVLTRNLSQCRMLCRLNRHLLSNGSDLMDCGFRFCACEDSSNLSPMSWG